MLDRIVHDLKSLPRLPLPHYTSPGVSGPNVWKKPELHAALEEVVRVCGALTVRGYWVTEAEFKLALEICKRTGSHLAIDWQVFHRFFPADAKYFDRGPGWWKEFEELRAKIALMKGWLEGSGVRVGAWVLECERFTWSDAAQTAAAQTARELVGQLIRHEFPNVPLEWYNRGGSDLVVAIDGDTFSVPLYQPHMPAADAKLFQRVCAEADKVKLPFVTPWIAVGAAYRHFDQPKGGKVKVWDWQFKVPPTFLWKLGAAINNADSRLLHPGTSWGRAAWVVFHPSPLEPLIPDNHWLACFSAYARGAAGLPLIDWTSPGSVLSTSRAALDASGAPPPPEPRTLSGATAVSAVNSPAAPEFADAGTDV